MITSNRMRWAVHATRSRELRNACSLHIQGIKHMEHGDIAEKGKYVNTGVNEIWCKNV
jgi:imidazolonepropionase-like amidohydrolase